MTSTVLTTTTTESGAKRKPANCACRWQGHLSGHPAVTLLSRSEPVSDDQRDDNPENRFYLQ